MPDKSHPNSFRGQVVDFALTTVERKYRKDEYGAEHNQSGNHRFRLRALTALDA
jgi:hypothetical protein